MSERTPARLGRLAPLLVYTALGIAQLAGAWRDWDHLGGKDWNYFLGQTQAEVTTLLRYGQLPLWMPWRCGGQPVWAQPETMLLSPVTPLALVAGTLAAFKLLLLPLFVAGCLGLHALSRRLGLSGAAAYAPALVFFGSSLFPLYVSGGWPNWLCALAILPWLLWALRRSDDDLRWLALAAALYAGLLYGGAIYPFIFVPVFLLAEAGVRALLDRRARPLLVALAALAGGVLLAAPRVLPLFEVYGLYPRQVPGDEEALPLSLLARVWLGPDVPPLISPRTGMVVVPDGAAYWPYVGAFMGPVALALAALGVTAGRAALSWIAAGALLLWMALGSGVRPALWPALHDLPVLGSMHAPQRLVLYASFGLALLAGLGAMRLQSWLAARGRERRAARLVAGLLALMTLHLAWVNAPIAATAFQLAPTPDLVFREPFRQEDIPARPEQIGGEGFEAVLRNAGSVYGFSDIPSPRIAVPSDDPDYRGEVFLLGGRGEVEARLTPNVIGVRARLDAADVLVVNQVWFPHWIAEGGGARRQLVEQDGLLALPLEAGVHELTLRYRPPAVTKGLAYGALAAAVVTCWLVVRRGRPVTRPGRPELVTLGACLLLGAGMARERPRLPEASAPPTAVRLAALEGALVVDAEAAAGDRARADAHTDVQSALDAAPPGALILVAPGRYAGFTVRRAVTLQAQRGGAVRITSPVRLEGLPRGEQVLLMGLADAPLELEGGLEAAECAGTLALQHARAAGSDLAACELVVLVESDLPGASPAALRMPPPAAGPASVQLTLSPHPSRYVRISLAGPAGGRGVVLLGLRPGRRAVGEGLAPLGVDVSGLFVTLPVELPADGRLELRLRAPVALMRPGLGLFAQLATVGAGGATAIGPPDGRFFEFLDPDR